MGGEACSCNIALRLQDMDFFGELTPEEQKAADEKKRVIEEAKARGAAKAKLTKSMIIMDVKPWDDTTGAPSACGPAAYYRGPLARRPVSTSHCAAYHGGSAGVSSVVPSLSLTPHQRLRMELAVS